jgi:hypothetical protein
MRQDQTWNRQKKIGILLIAVGIFILLAAIGIENRHEAKPLYLSGSSEEIAGEPNEQSTVRFSITLHNPGDRDYAIEKIVPVVSDQAAHLIVVEPQFITANDRIGKNKELTYYSQFIIDTSTLTADEITSIIPIIRSYVVTYGEGQVAILDIQ